MRDNLSPRTVFRLCRIVTIVALGAGVTVACDQAPPDAQQVMAPPAVTVAYPVQQQITEWDDLPVNSKP